MSKVIEFTTTRKFDTIELTENLYAYKETLLVNSKEVEVKEGVVAKEALDNLELESELEDSKFKLYDNILIEELKNKMLFHDFKDIRKHFIENPYTHILENGQENTKLLNVCYSNHNIYTLNNKRCVKAENFDYANGYIINKYFDLKKSLEILRKRNDVELIEDKIQYLPNYDCYDEYEDVENELYLEFIWKPTDKYIDEIQNIPSHYDIKDYVINNILKLPKATKNQ